MLASQTGAAGAPPLIPLTPTLPQKLHRKLLATLTREQESGRLLAALAVGSRAGGHLRPDSDFDLVLVAHNQSALAQVAHNLRLAWPQAQEAIALDLTGYTRASARAEATGGASPWRRWITRGAVLVGALEAVFEPECLSDFRIPMSDREFALDLAMSHVVKGLAYMLEFKVRLITHEDIGLPFNSGDLAARLLSRKALWLNLARVPYGLTLDASTEPAEPAARLRLTARELGLDPAPYEALVRRYDWTPRDGATPLPPCRAGEAHAALDLVEELGAAASAYLRDQTAPLKAS